MSEPRVDHLKKVLELSDWEERLTQSIADKLEPVIRQELQSLADRMEANQITLNEALLRAAKAALKTRL